MGSSFTLLNNTETIVYVSSDIEWAIIGPILIGIGAIFAIILAVATGGAAATYIPTLFTKVAGEAAFATAFYPAVTGLAVFLVSSVVAILAAVPGVLGITAIATATPRMLAQMSEAQGVTLTDMHKMQAQVRKLTKGMKKLEPGEYYKFSGTLSLSRRVKVVWDDGAVSSKTCWTASRNKKNRQYKVLDRMFATKTFVGCYKDRASNRVMEKKMKGTGDLDKCKDRCRNYEFFGMEAGRQCFCSNNMGFIDPAWMKANGMRKEKECNENGKHKGGSWRIAVHKITPSPKYLELYAWKKQQKAFRRMEIGNATAEARRLLGYHNEEAVELIQDFADMDAYAALRVMDELTPEELSQDHRRLGAGKRGRVQEETYEGDKKHDFRTAVANHLVDSLITAEISPDAVDECEGKVAKRCKKCVRCMGCLEDNTRNICSTAACTQCDDCAAAIPCLAMRKGCSSKPELRERMQCLLGGTADLSVEERCGPLRQVLQCVVSKAGRKKSLRLNTSATPTPTPWRS